MIILGYKFDMFHLILASVLLFIIYTTTTCSCMKHGFKETFTLLAESYLPVTNIKHDSYEKIADPYKTNKLKGNKQSNLMWENNEFSKDCCVNNQSNYYNRNGCVCATEEQVRHLSQRAGNNK